MSLEKEDNEEENNNNNKSIKITIYWMGSLAPDEL